MAAVLLFADATAARAQTNSAMEDVQSRMVKIFGAGGLGGLHAYGTGFLVSSEGHIATVWSHVLDTNTVTAVLSDGRRFYAKVLGADIEHDVALLKIEAEGLPAFDLTRAIEVSPGTRVLAFSNMFKVAAGDERMTVQRGVIAAKSTLDARRGRFQAPYRGPVYVIDAVINNPGAAGGVVTTVDGRLVGMIGREVKNAQSETWINYAVPISELTGPIEALRTGDFRPKDPFAETEPTGKSMTALDFGLVLLPDVVARTPAYIDEVLPESPAARAGLAPEDLVVFVNGDLVGSISSLNGVLAKILPGDDVQFTVRRGDDLVNVTLQAPQKAVSPN